MHSRATTHPFYWYWTFRRRKHIFLCIPCKKNSILVECCFPCEESSWLAVRWRVCTKLLQFGPAALPLESFTTFRDQIFKMNPSPIPCEFLVLLCCIVSREYEHSLIIPVRVLLVTRIMTIDVYCILLCLGGFWRVCWLCIPPCLTAFILSHENAC